MLLLYQQIFILDLSSLTFKVALNNHVYTSYKNNVQGKLKCRLVVISFPVRLRNRLISVGLEPVYSIVLQTNFPKY